jgi:hypothetical protein
LKTRTTGIAAATLLSVITLSVITAAATHGAVTTWSQRFAAETDTVVFFSAEGLLWKAPFSMASAETLWAPKGRERLTRLEVSPDGTRAAWITSGSEQDTVKLWTGATRPTQPRALYFSFQPSSMGRVHFEAGVPTTSDPSARGPRLVNSSPRLLRAVTTPMAWFPDGSAIAFGYSDGVAVSPGEQGDAVPAFDLPVVSLRCLDPAALFLAEFVPPPPKSTDPQRTDPNRSDWHLLFPGGRRWTAFPTEDFHEGMPWVASSTTLWWAKGPEVRTSHVHNPQRQTAGKMHTDVVGLARDRNSEILTIVATDEVARLEPAGTPRRLARLALPARRMFVDPDSGSVAAVFGDSVLITDGDMVRRAALKGLDASGMMHSGERLLLWGTETKSSHLAMAWLEPDKREVQRIETPVEKGDVFASPGRRWVFAARSGGKPPEKLHAFELSSGTWSEVDNPGIAGWEPFSAR